MNVPSPAIALLLGDRTPRADAERNVTALLAATRNIVLAGDLNPSAAQIAEAAGVGVGTLYRRALGKEALLAAAVIDLLDDVCKNASARSASETWQGFETFAMDYVRVRAVTCAITHALDDALNANITAAKQRTRATLENLTDRLHAANLLAPDVDAAQLMVLLASIDITEDTLDLAPDSSRRILVLRRLLSSLRA